MGAIPAHPGPILLPNVPYRIGPGRAETGFLATSDFQRNENGGLDPSWLDFAFLGCPDFQSRGLKMLVLKGPRRNKRCFLNGVFRSGLFRGSSRSARARRHQNASKHCCFQAFFAPLKGFISVASRG